ncbi:MAG: membrane protein insertase YidC [Clostridia bacterium]|nr:membrane protein insertase YidC [Clostridia bacterium]
MGKIISFLAGIFGYLLNFIYGYVNNYGLAIILFTIAVQIILLPFSIRQQKTLIKNNKIQAKVKELQDKYKNDQVRLGQETMDLYKKEKMSPCSGCFESIIQLILFISIFYLVRQPLTYMENMDKNKINEYIEKYQISQQSNYKEIDIIREAKKAGDASISINMNFLGIDLSNIPSRNWGDPTVYIIPGLYVISSIISMKLTTTIGKKKLTKEEKEEEERKKREQKALIKPEEDEDDFDTVEAMNKQMMFMMPIMAVSVAAIAPLGLALYWLINNITSTIQRLVLGKIMKSKKEDEDE